MGEPLDLECAPLGRKANFSYDTDPSTHYTADSLWLQQWRLKLWSELN